MAPKSHPVKAWRKAQRPRWWTQVLLAEHAGVSPYQVARLEMGGTIEVEALTRIAAFTGLAVPKIANRAQRRDALSLAQVQR